jgi:serine/threonine protein kinase
MRNQEYTTKADVYSMGIILWELLTKQQKLFSEVRTTRSGLALSLTSTELNVADSCAAWCRSSS